jgi:hypothetical protein
MEGRAMTAIALLFLVKLIEVPAWINFILGVCTNRWLVGAIASPIVAALGLGLLWSLRDTPIDAPLLQWIVGTVAAFVAFALGRLLRQWQPPKPFQD